MARLARRIAILALGWGFILLGIVGLVLPVLQGFLFLLIGLALLSSESKTARRILERLRALPRPVGADRSRRATGKEVVGAHFSAPRPGVLT